MNVTSSKIESCKVDAFGIEARELNRRMFVRWLDVRSITMIENQGCQELMLGIDQGPPCLEYLRVRCKCIFEATNAYNQWINLWRLS